LRQNSIVLHVLESCLGMGMMVLPR